MSTLESFPELFGIEPTKGTEEFRAQHPVLGFASQAAGAFVPYVGAAKVLRAVPLAEAGLSAFEGLAGESAFGKAALGAIGETAGVEAGRLALSATGAPQALYAGVTGRNDAEQKPLAAMAGDSLVNIGAAGVLGGAVGALGARFAKGPKIQDVVPGAAPDQPLVKQIQAINDTINQANDPNHPLNLDDATLTWLDRERLRRIKSNLGDVVPIYGETGETIPSNDRYKQDLGNAFRPLEGDNKNDEISGWLNKRNKEGRGSSGQQTVQSDTQTAVKRLIASPDGYTSHNSPAEVQDVMANIGVDRETFGTYAQDAKTVEVKTGVGKKPLPDDYASPLDWVKNKVGQVVDFYHGTSHDIQDWKVGSRGGISFSTNPEFASQWTAGKAAPRVYITAIKANPEAVGDYLKPADVMKAIQAAGGDPNNPALHADYKGGDWSKWENTKMLHQAGWDTVYMVENPQSNGVSSSRNIFVTNGERIYSAFDPKVQWAKNLRLHASEPVHNLPLIKDPLQSKANGLQRRFTGKAFSDVGNDVRMAREKGPDGMFVMAKKVRGDPLNAAPGDKWAFWRTNNPETFAPKAQARQDIVLDSGYFHMTDPQTPVGEVMFDSTGAAMKMFDENQVKYRQVRKGKVHSMISESLDTAGNYVSPTALLGSKHPLLAKGFSLLDHVTALADARVFTLMNGESKLLPGKNIIGNILSLKGPKTDGLNDFIKTLTKQDLADISHIDEMSLAMDGDGGIKHLHGRGIISDATMRFFEHGQALADYTYARAQKLLGVVNDPSITRTLTTFKSRNSHFALTREYPGAYKYVLEDPDGNWIGTASGVSPKDAQTVADDIIKKQAERGKIVVRGGLIDEAMASGEDFEKLNAAVRAPGFIKARSDMIGYELSRGELTQKKLSDVVARNVRMRENFFRDIAIREKLAPTLQQLYRQAPQYAIALDKRIRIMQGDEGEFSRTQNAMMDKALHAVGLSGKNSATNIVRGTQKLLGAWTFGFGSLPQVLMNLMGTFQTLMPHVSFILNASPERLSRNFASMPLLDGANNVKGTFGMLSSWKVLKNSLDLIATDSNKLPDDFKELFETMVKRGKLAPRFIEEQFGSGGNLLGDPIAAMRQGHSFGELLGQTNQLLMTKTEELNRSMAVAASYVLGKEAGLSGERLAIFTQEMFAQTMYNYSTVDRATVFTTPLGSLTGTFKNWIFHYMGSMLKYADAGKEGLAPLMWQTASTALLGGAAATPFVMPIANAFSNFANGQNAMQNLYAAAGNLGLNEHVADGVMYGLPGMMGVSLSSQAASPGADPARDASMMFGIAAFDRMRSLSGGVKDAISAAAISGVSPWDDAKVRGELTRALAPRTLYRAMAIGQDGAMRSLNTGNTIMSNVGVGDHILYAAGFNPTELDKTYQVFDEMKNDQDKKKAMTQQFGTTLAQAWASGDDRNATRVFTRAMAVGVDTSSVLRSAQSHTKRNGEKGLLYEATPEEQSKFSFMFDQPQ
jgi:hypothetical protein